MLLPLIPSNCCRSIMLIFIMFIAFLKLVLAFLLAITFYPKLLPYMYIDIALINLAFSF